MSILNSLFFYGLAYILLIFFFFFEISAILSPKECSATGQLCIRELLSYSDPFNSEYNKSHAAFHIKRATYTLGRNRGVGVVTHDHNAYHCASRLPRRSLSFSSLTVIEWALDDSALRKVMTSNYNYWSIGNNNTEMQGVEPDITQDADNG